MKKKSGNDKKKIKNLKECIKQKISKDNIKKLLFKINFAKFTWILVKIMVVGIIIAFLGKTNDIYLLKILGIILILGDLILMFLEMVLYQLKTLIDDIGKIFFSIVCVAFYFYIVISYGTLINKIVPNFPEYKNEMMQLFIYSFTGIIPAFVGVVATYFAAIHGGKKAMEATEKQLDAQAEKEKDRLKKNKSIAIRIIVKLLKEEIEDNVKCLKKAQLLEQKKIYKSNHEYVAIKQYLKFVDYDNVKYEIIKYSDEDIVEEVIDIYEIFRIFARHDNLNEMGGKEFNKITKLEQKYNSFLKKIESKELY